MILIGRQMALIRAENDTDDTGRDTDDTEKRPRSISRDTDRRLIGFGGHQNWVAEGWRAVESGSERELLRVL